MKLSTSTYRWARVGVGLALLALAAIIVCGIASTSYDRTLVGGYRLIKSGSADVAVYGKDGVLVVGMTVKSIGASDAIIVGEIVHPTPGAYHPYADDIQGYFVIDTQSDAVSRGLTKEQAQALVVTYRATMPRLKNPDYWFGW